ncbi:MAG: amidohydrolase family protein, partial [Acidimicrobiaceae bacterium]|nr:amidohydrolase family protein [Acidimicrobiaceae bacterium]
MTLLPDPPRQPRTYTIISVDDHLIEPPDLFEGRMPAALADRAPTLVESADGSQVWEYEDNRYPNIGLNAVVGRPKDEWSMEPARFDEMRKGCWDIHARVADMDVAGVWASLCFPSLIAGFAGSVFSRSRDPELGLACVRAWNDWHHEVWAGTYPERIIPLQITWLLDPHVGAAEVRRNAARGFKALSFPENPHHIGLPSMHTRHWDPLLEACEETGTVVCLHTGSSGWSASTSPGAPLEQLTTLFPVNGVAATADWLWAGIPVRFPTLNV